MIEWRCKICGRVDAGRSEEKPLCCGVFMLPGTNVNGRSREGLRVDVVQKKDAKRRLYWTEGWEVWFLWPGRDGRAIGDNERIGWCGKLINGMWEYEMVPGVKGREGVGFNRDDVVKKMLVAYDA
jgi:hypothetical protein